MSKVLIRADGGATVGMGHLMRCRTLAIALQLRGWKTVFLSEGVPGEGFADDQGRKFEVVDPSRSGTNGAGTAQVAEQTQADLVLIDTYTFGMKDFLALWKSGRPLVVIDDLADRGLPVDAVINPNPLFPDTRYREQGIPHCLIGSDYCLIRPEVLVARQLSVRQERHLLVTLGGGGVPEVLLPLLPIMESSDFHQITVMASTSAPKLEAWVQAHATRWQICRDFSSLPRLVAEADAVVSAGGTTLWEVYCVGRPSLAIVWVDNQRHALRVVDAQRTGTVVDLRRGFDEQVFTRAWQEFLDSRQDQDCIERQQQLIDGRGAERAAEVLLRLG
ncbi:MAG TPA: UDP-2,4-diacetamido-2,4,6-trideoxy-beta-L-altropyranose hydrolase [Candidatus Ozemobacteraceae bacterium]|nr:UDP-2,4-diacetamido-2,4,6-trideoxy-beta-L-altropyranose hydrolase [Candidatus Ozemobacteraceae bacterium]